MRQLLSGSLVPRLATSRPKSLEPAASHACVMDRVLGVAMTQVVLDEAQIVALVGKVEAAGMAQHMRMDGAEPRPLGGRADQVVHRLARERLAALGDEQPWQPIRPRGEIALDGAQLRPGDRLLDRQAILQALLFNRFISTYCRSISSQSIGR